MGAAAAGIAAAGPIITTFSVPAAAALTSGCDCTNGKVKHVKEFFWNILPTPDIWSVSPTTTSSPCQPACWTVGALSTGTDNIISSADIGVLDNVNSPFFAAPGADCSEDPNEGIFSVTAVYTNAGGTDCVEPGDGTIAFAGSSLATVTAAAEKTLSRIFVVACC